MDPNEHCYVGVIQRAQLQSEETMLVLGGAGSSGSAAIQLGKAVGAIDGTGRVRVHGEYWNAVSDEPIVENARVRIESVDGLTITVKREEE